MHCKARHTFAIIGSDYQQMSNSTRFIRKFRFFLDFFDFPLFVMPNMLFLSGHNLWSPPYLCYQAAEIDPDLRCILVLSRGPNSKKSQNP